MGTTNCFETSEPGPPCERCEAPTLFRGATVTTGSLEGVSFAARVGNCACFAGKMPALAHGQRTPELAQFKERHVVAFRSGRYAVAVAEMAAYTDRQKAAANDDDDIPAFDDPPETWAGGAA